MDFDEFHYFSGCWFQNVSNTVHFHPYLGKISNLRSIFFRWVGIYLHFSSKSTKCRYKHTIDGWYGIHVQTSSPLCLGLPLQRRDVGHWITTRSGQREHLAEATFKYQASVESTWAMTKNYGLFRGFVGDLYPIPSMYGIFTYIWLIFMVNVGKYTIHGWYGY